MKAVTCKRVCRPDWEGRRHEYAISTRQIHFLAPLPVSWMWLFLPDQVSDQDLGLSMAGRRRNWTLATSTIQITGEARKRDSRGDRARARNPFWAITIKHDCSCESQRPRQRHVFIFTTRPPMTAAPVEQDLLSLGVRVKEKALQSALQF